MLPEIDYSPLTHPVEPPARTDANAFAVSRLASANGWQYFTHAVAQELPGVVFRDPDGRARFSQRAVNIVRIPGDPMIEVGDSFYTEVAVGNQFPQWGYAAVDLGVAVPPFTVEAKSNRARSALPSTPARAVKDNRRPGVVVEAARGSEQAVDALLTPEIVAALSDETNPLDAEFSGGWLFLYAPRSLSTADAESWKHLLRTVDLFVDRVGNAPRAGAPVAEESSPLAVGSSAPAPGVFSASPAVPAQSRGARVNGGRVGWYLAAVVGAMAIAGGAALLFGGR